MIRILPATLAVAFILALVLSSSAALAKNPKPSGAIGGPWTGTPTPTGWLAPAISSTSRPPREHLTMPPTDTAP